MEKRKYHYEYFAYTNNMNYGRVYLGQSSSLTLAKFYGYNANKGCFDIEKHRVYD